MLILIAAAVAALGLQSASPKMLDPAVAFGAREAIEQASISPDGSTFAYLGPLHGQGTALFVVPVDGSAPAKPVLTSSGEPERIGSCRWAAATRLVCYIYGITRLDIGDITYFSRYIAVDSNGGNVKVLFQGRQGEQLGYKLYGGEIIDWLPDEDGNILMMREYIPERSTGTHLAQTREGIGVDRTDTRTGQASPVEGPRDAVQDYITDGRGTVRIMGVGVSGGATGYMSGKTRYYYRMKDSREWKQLSLVDENKDGFIPYGVDPAENVVYGLKRLNGRRAAYKIALDGTKTETLVYAHPQSDIDSFVHIGRRGRIVGVSFATERRENIYFDSTLAKLAASLSKAIPKLPLIRFVDSSVDESKLLIFAGSDNDPGRFYLFDRNRKELNELLDARPALAGTALSTVKPISYKAADGTMIPGYLTLPPGKETAKGLPAIVMPHGGPSYRDEWGFDWLSQYFANRGYAVLQPNFRGSAGYGSEWFQKNGFQSWRTAIGDVDDGGRWLVAEGIADPKKLAIVGWSYGGYAALQSAVTEPGLFGAIVAIAPVTDLELLKEERRNWGDYTVVSRFVGSGPHIEQGSPARNAGKIKAPVLLFHGTDDRNVGVRQSRLMASRLKGAGVPSELVVYKDRDHYLEDSKIRAEMLGKTDSFLRTTLKL